VAAGVGVSICAGAVADGATSPGAAGDDDWSLHAASASAQATARTVSLIFIVKSPWLGSSSSNSDGLHHAKTFAADPAACTFIFARPRRCVSAVDNNDRSSVDRGPRASHPDSVAAGA
jgi:hypothetical protein